MRQLILLGTWTLVGALLVTTGLYLLVSRPSLPGGARSQYELASCIMPDEAEIRLYQGDLGSARDASPARDSSDLLYTVTHDPSGLEPERPILHRRRKPVLYDLACDADGVIIRNDSAPIGLTPVQARRLRDALRDRRFPELTRPAGGATLVIVGLGLLWFLRPKQDEF